MRAIWMFLAAIATPLVAPADAFAEQKDAALTHNDLPPAPIAEQRPHEVTLHGRAL